MGWYGTYNAGPTKPFLIKEMEGDPLGCNTCGYYEKDHPRVVGREYDSIYGAKADSEYPPAHDFVPHVQIYKVLDYAATLTVAYMAVESLTDFPYGKGKVFATITLIRRTRDGTLTTKDQSESMGPYETTCPARILDLLSPIEALYTGTSAEYASKWREECRARLAMKASRPKLTSGSIFRIKQPMQFTNGMKYDTFQIFTGQGWSKRRREVRAYPNGPYVHFNFRELDYELVTP